MILEKMSHHCSPTGHYDLESKCRLYHKGWTRNSPKKSSQHLYQINLHRIDHQDHHLFQTTNILDFFAGLYFQLQENQHMKGAFWYMQLAVEPTIWKIGTSNFIAPPEARLINPMINNQCFKAPPVVQYLVQSWALPLRLHEFWVVARTEKNIKLTSWWVEYPVFHGGFTFNCI